MKYNRFFAMKNIGFFLATYENIHSPAISDNKMQIYVDFDKIL